MATSPSRPSCPAPAVLKRFLSDDLAPPDADDVETHVGGCTDCQQVLQRLVESPSGSADAFPGWLDSFADERAPELPGYEPIGRIDAGGMGVVWRVRDLAFQRALAVKVMKAKTGHSAHAVRRFLAEAQTTGRLAHPSIVPVHAKGYLPDGRPYFTMKLVQGETLAVLLKDRPDPASGQAGTVRIFAQVCQAVAYAHSEGVIHRDLKPANVMVGKFGEVQVMDWGLAKSGVRNQEPGASEEEDESLPTSGAADQPPGPVGATHALDGDTRPGAVMGTLPYMPPEQARGEVALLDQRCDVFALGAILCEILTGAPPYRSGTRDEMLRQAANGELADALARLDACGADAELVGLAKSCLVPQREERPPDAGAVAAAVVAHEANVEKRLRLVEVERGKAQVRAREERKRRRLASVLTVAVLLGLAGLAVGVVLLGRKNQQLVTINGQLEHANREAQLRGEQAARARDRTFQALDAMTSRVTGESLETQQAITPEQKKFLAEVLTYYQEFAREQGNDEGTRRRVAAAAYRVGLIQLRLGDLEASVRAFEQSRDAYEQLAAGSPGVPQYRYFTAYSHNNLGRLFQELGRFREAEEAYRRSLVVREELAATYAGLPRYPHAVASSHNNLGVLLRELGKRAEAETAFRRATALWEKLAADFPGTYEFRQDLALSHHNLGLLFAEQDKRPEAGAAFRRALALREELAAAHGRPEDRQALAASLCIHGFVLKAADKRTEAEAAYQRARELQQKLVDEFPLVPEYRQELASSYRVLGALLHGSRKRVEAEAAYRRALDLHQKLVDEFPLVPRYRRELACCHGDLGLLFNDLGNEPEADAAHRRALALLEKLAADFSNVYQYRQDLARTYHHLGSLLRSSSKRRPEAEAAYRRAIALREKLASEFRDVVEYRLELSDSYNNLGLVLKERDKRPEAEAAYQQAQLLGEKLMADFPAVLRYQTKLAATSVNFGNLLSKDGRATESLAYFGRAIALMKPKVQADPQLGAEQQILRTAHWGRALALDKLDRPAESIADWDRAVDLSLARDKPTVRAVRARSLVRAGQVERAVAEAADLAKSAATATQLYDLACVYALAAGRDEAKRNGYTETALKLLQRAVDCGFKDAELLKTDDDFKLLRDHEEFRELLTQLENPPK
jgi:tetratricopeptide (TPR) repeat protein